MNNKFAALWPKSTPRLQAGIAVFSILGAAAAMATGIGGFAAGAIGMWHILAAGGIALAMHGAIKVIAEKGLAENMIRGIGRKAPRDIQAIADDIFAKSGLDQKYKPVVLITDSSLLGKKKPSGKNRAMFDCGAFVLPSPVGRNKDQILIGIGRRAADALDEDELTAVLAHEAGHIINRPPNMNNVFSTTKHLATGLLLTSAVFNPAIIPVAAAGYLATHLSMARGKKYDEERADRTSMSLFPHKTALISALNKLKPMMMEELYPNGKTPLYYLRRLNSLLLGDHPMVPTRARYAAKYYEESAQFHKENGLTVSPAAYRNQDVGGPWSSHKPDVLRFAPLRVPETTPGLRATWNNTDVANDTTAPTQKDKSRLPGLNGPA